MAALSHELLWTRRLVDLLGATDWVVGRVLGLFFLGISLGGYLAHRYRISESKALVRLAVVEFMVALLALPAAFLPLWTDWIWAAIGSEALVSWQGALIKFALVSLVVMPPAIAMGFTLPLFVKSATNLGGSVASLGIWTYAFNTLGGVAGLWVTSTFLVGWLGAQSSMLTIAALNGLIAMLATLLARLTHQGELGGCARRPVDDPKWAVRTFSPAELVVLSFLSGVIVLSLEILVLRLMALVVPTSYHTTSALLANVILILAISAAVISLLNRFVKSSIWPLVVGLVGGAVCCCFCPAILYHQTDQLISLRFLQGLNGHVIESIHHYWLLVFWLVAVASGLSLLCCGLVFPSLLSLSSNSDPAGNRIGLLLAANGIGGLLGCELVNSVVIPLVGIYHGFFVVALTVAVLGLVIIGRKNAHLAIGVGAAFLLVVYVAYDGVAELPYISPRSTRNYQVEQTVFGREGVLLVVTDNDQSKSILMNNQYVLGSTGVAIDERRQLLPPWLLQPDAQSVCSLGLATGISSGGLENLAEPPPVTAVELSASVVQLAENHFEQETQGFFDRLENSVIVEDARVYMASTTNKFDLIVADLFRPHGMGEGRLYSVEHFKNVRRALSADGVFCQWLPMYQLNRKNFEIIAATYQSVFPDALVVLGNADPRFPVLGLVARKTDASWQRPNLLGRLSDLNPVLIENDGLLKNAPGLVLGLLDRQEYSNSQINTLDNLVIEIAAGNSWILSDLRKNRPPADAANMFLSGIYFVDFLNQLCEETTPVFATEHRRKMLQAIKARLGRRQRSER